MSRNKKDVFKEIISKAEPQKPTDDMANLVMQQIAAANEDEVAINPALKRLLQQHAADAAPMGFTHSIMAQITPQQAALTYKPIISKKTWYTIAASILCILVIIAWLGNSGQQVYNAGIGDSTIKQIDAMPPVYIITLTFGGLLLVLEHLITSRLKLHK